MSQKYKLSREKEAMICSNCGRTERFYEHRVLDTPFAFFNLTQDLCVSIKGLTTSVVVFSKTHENSCKKNRDAW
ncbi:hypothetical protein CNR22_15225 [Sphingobacteriaceae bacterium]|nr:hypothetical protein CNR22_15225 [Sphingobacteriaceae bacterium]